MQSPKTPITPAVTLLVTTGCAVNCIMYQAADCLRPCDSSGKRFEPWADCHSHSPAKNNQVCQVVGWLVVDVGRIRVEAAEALSVVDDKAALATDGTRKDTMAKSAKETTLRFAFLSNPNNPDRDSFRSHGFRILAPSCALLESTEEVSCRLSKRRVDVSAPETGKGRILSIL